MRPNNSQAERQIKAFCADIGRDPLLVQGAGGNVSWKEEHTLWIKASGTWLADAEKTEIFLPVDLHRTREAMRQGLFDAPPALGNASRLKPSIETLLHALMPHPVVVHLHAIEVLAHLVREDPEPVIASLLGNSVRWACVEYFKPGAELAAAVADALEEQTCLDVVFLRNHGVVIGAENIGAIHDILHRITMALKNELLPERPDLASAQDTTPIEALGYRPSDVAELNALANQSSLYARLMDEWALYPDHVVFLGPRPVVLEGPQAMSSFCRSDIRPPYVFVRGNGTYASSLCTPAQEAQLRCYADVLVRQRAGDRLTSLDDVQIASLLNWDAEKYRQQLARETSTVA